MKITFLIVLTISSIFINAQTNFYLGRVEYSKSLLAASGNYIKKSESITMFSLNGYNFCTKINEADQLQMIDNIFNKPLKATQNIPMDSLSIAKYKKKIRASLKTSNKGSYIEYNSHIQKSEQDILGVDYLIVDTLSKIYWTLTPDTMTIDGLFCQKARCTFIGKLFNVWFTTKIEVQAGPLLLYGLPGLIILAISEDKKTMYKMEKIEYPLKEKIRIQEFKNDRKVSKAQFDLLKIEAMKGKLDRRKEIKDLQ